MVLVDTWLVSVLNVLVKDVVFRGCKIELIFFLPQSHDMSNMPGSPNGLADLHAALEDPLDQVAIVPDFKKFQGFYSNMLIVTRQKGFTPLILDLKALNAFICFQKFPEFFQSGRLYSLCGYQICFF